MKNKNKKLLSITLAILMLFSCTSLVSFADESSLSASVFVTVSNKGELVAAQEKVTVSDVDNDGALTVNDALYAVHEAKYEGGAANGYNSYYGDYGYSLGKLWGDESGSFGYTVNNISCWSLADPVSEGDYVYAYIYTDTDYFSDAYSFFNANTVIAKAGDEISLTLSALGYDEEWNTVTVPVENAVITVNSEKTEYKTDAEGKATIKIDFGGSYVISAVSDSQILVPPVCLATFEESESTPSDIPTQPAEPTSTKPTSTEPTKVIPTNVTTAATTASVTTAAKTTKPTTTVNINTAATKAFKLKAVKGKKQIKISYKKVAGAAGFQVRYKIKGKWKVKTFKAKKNATKLIKNLKKGTYKVQVRSFKKTQNGRVFSKWSKTKKVKVK